MQLEFPYRNTEQSEQFEWFRTVRFGFPERRQSQTIWRTNINSSENKYKQEAWFMNPKLMMPCQWMEMENEQNEKFGAVKMVENKRQNFLIENLKV